MVFKTTSIDETSCTDKRVARQLPHMEMILEIIASVCLIGGGMLLVYKLLNDKRFFHNDSSGGGQKVFRGK